MVPLLYTTGKHEPRDSRQLFAGSDSRVMAVRLNGWRSERHCKIFRRICPCSRKKWEQMTKEQRSLARHLTISYGMFPPLRLLSLSDSPVARARNKLLRPTNEAASLLLKTITVRKMTLSFFLLPTLFHPHGRWTEVKAKPCSLKTSLLQCWLSVDVLMKWHIIIIFSSKMPLLKLPPVRQREPPCSAGVLRDEMRWEGLVNDSNEIWAKVWLDLSYYLAWFLISRQHIIEEKRIGRKRSY